MDRIRNTNTKLVEVQFIKKQYKITTCAFAIPLEALLIPKNLTDGDTNGIGGGTQGRTAKTWVGG